MEHQERKCTNCAHCDRYIGLCKEERMRCWYEPGVCDHAFAISLKEAANYVCENHAFKEEWEQELYDRAVFEYESLKKSIKSLEEKYPQLKDIKI